jgi:hypothetical protein
MVRPAREAGRREKVEVAMAIRERERETPERLEAGGNAARSR